MTTAMQPKVKRLPAPMSGGRMHWCVTCPCADTGDNMFSMFGGDVWLRCTGWRTALVVAHWHASLHREQRCPTCLHEPPLPKPEIVSGDQPLFRWDGRLFTIADGRVCEMEAVR